MTKVLCDHGKCRTPFCPYCGQDREKGSPLFGLFRHCQNVAARLEREAARIVGAFPSYSQKIAINAERWRSWTDALKAVLDAPH